jgi:thioredoxin 1
MSENLLVITEATFDAEVLNSETPVIVDFWAEWCGPCRMLTPILDEVAGEYKGKIKIGKINVDDNPNIAQKFSVRGIPTLILFKDGEIVTSKVGMLSKKQLIDFIDTNI